VLHVSASARQPVGGTAHLGGKTLFLRPVSRPRGAGLLDAFGHTSVKVPSLKSGRMASSLAGVCNPSSVKHGVGH